MFKRCGLACALAAIPLALFLTGCVSTEVVGPYRHADCIDERPGHENDDHSCTSASRVPELKVFASLIDPTEAAQINAAPASTPAAVGGDNKSKKVFDLSDHALAKFLELVAKSDETKAAALRKALQASLVPDAVSPAIKDQSALSGTLEVVLRDQLPGKNPSDYVDLAFVTIKLTNARLKSVIAARTIYDTIDEGTVAATNTSGQEISPNIGALLGVPGLGAGKLSASQSQTQTLPIKVRVEDTTAFPDYVEQSITIVRQGGAFRGVGGKIYVTLALQPNDSRVAELFSVKSFKDEKKWKKPDEIEVSSQRVVIPTSAANAILASVTVDYRVRHGLSGDNTAPQADDDVEFRTKSAEQGDVSLLSGPRLAGYLQETFGLVPSTGRNPGSALYAYDTETRRPNIALCFGTYGQAEDLRRYLNRTKSADEPRHVLGMFEIGQVAPVNGLPSFFRIEANEVPTLQVRPGCSGPALKPGGEEKP